MKGLKKMMEIRKQMKKNGETIEEKGIQTRETKKWLNNRALSIGPNGVIYFKCIKKKLVFL